MSETPACDLPPAHQNNSNGSSGAVPALRSQDFESTFELLLTLVYPSKRVRTSSKKTKNMKPESDNKGPYDVPINIEWDAFLGVVAEKLMVVPSTLVVTSFKWHWLKPASSPWLPIQDENGFASMLKKVKTKSDPYIIVRMQAPIQRKVTATLVFDIEDELDSDLEDTNRVSKKVCILSHCSRSVTQFPQAKLDDALEEIVAKLAEKYPPGLCDHHLDLPCFHHRVSDLHFNLDCPRLLVWAQAIKSKRATYKKVPILSPMFKASLALKFASKNAKKATDSDITAATNTPPVMQLSTFAQGQMPTMPFANFPQYPQVPFPQMYPQMPSPLPPFMGYAPSMPYPGNPFVAAGPSMVPMPMKAPRSPPSSPPTANCTVAEFCELYDLGEQAEVGLERLGFRFGDDLSTVTADEYAIAGFKPLEWRRVLRAYRKLKHDNHY